MHNRDLGERLLFIATAIVVVVAIFIGCGPNETSRGRQQFATLCRNCGAEWVGERSQPIYKCPGCPLGVCETGLRLLFHTASVQGLVDRNPDDEEYKDLYWDAIQDVEKHWYSCEQCRNATGE